jgi:catechol 2,3-dioxygenase-like lactoylglutathione lyase family enzyme
MADSSGTPTVPTLEARALGASLTVNDLPRSLAWYRDVLGFAVAREYAPQGTLVAVALRAGTVEFLLTQDNGAQGTNRAKGQGFSLQFTIGNSAEDIDVLAAGIKQRGGMLEDEPANIAGARAFRLRDPDGFKLVFSSPRER